MVGYEYGYSMFKEFQDMYVDGSKHEPDLSVGVSKINVTIIKAENKEDKETQLSISAKVLIDGQSNDTLFMLNLIYTKSYK